MMARLRPYGFPKLHCAWSRLNDYGKYFELQSWIRQTFTLSPLDLELLSWMNPKLDLAEHLMASERTRSKPGA